MSKICGSLNHPEQETVNSPQPPELSIVNQRMNRTIDQQFRPLQNSEQSQKSPFVASLPVNRTRPKCPRPVCHNMRTEMNLIVIPSHFS